MLLAAAWRLSQNRDFAATPKAEVERLNAAMQKVPAGAIVKASGAKVE